ncbi:MAG: hypothetical protein IPJ88_07260 [Myxococcales bacterium]|nr:MAG: hypothetical protein IPJ88_07260 [Myxococcales bacterium]
MSFAFRCIATFLSASLIGNMAACSVSPKGSDVGTDDAASLATEGEVAHIITEALCEKGIFWQLDRYGDCAETAVQKS